LQHENCRDFALQLLPFEKTTRERLGIQCSKLSSMKSVISVPATLNQRLGGMRVPAFGNGTDQARRRFPLKRQGVEDGWTSEIGACAQARNTQNRWQKCEACASP
jgi:hypothetical protein